MIEAYVKRGFQKEGVASLVTVLRRKVSYGEVCLFYCDSEYNVKSLRTVLQSEVGGAEFKIENYSKDFLSEFVRGLDEKLLQLDVICRCLVMIWVSPDGKKLTLKAGDFLNVYETFEGWDEGVYATNAILFFPSRGDTDMYLGSGICLPLVAEIPEGNFVTVISDNTKALIDKAGVGFSSEKYYVDIYSDKPVHQQTQNALDLNNYSELLMDGRIDKVMNEIQKDYFENDRGAFSQFISLIS